VSATTGYAKGRAKRSEILDQATALFGEVGYRSASLREIASRCGISHPGLLHHFPSKELLLVALVRRNAERRGIVELFATLSAEATSPEHPAHAYFVERYRNAVALMARAFADAEEDGALAAGVDPESAARELVALMDGLQVQWLLDPSSTDMPRLVRDHVERQLRVPLAEFHPEEATP
jgi:AcrR family transcriptional regulator